MNRPTEILVGKGDEGRRFGDIGGDELMIGAEDTVEGGVPAARDD